MKRIYCHIILAFCLLACGKKFVDPNGNRFLAANVTASPLTVASDSLVTITGQGFSTNPDQDLVYFNGTGAAVLQATATQLVVKVPAAGATGSITVRVNGEQANGPLFTYPTSSLFSISPASGADSTTITLTTALHVSSAATTTVGFGNLTGKVLYTDSNRIIVSAPVGVQTGQLSIQTNGQQYAGPVFTRTTIQSITPNKQGAGSGQTIQIIGTGFNPQPKLNAVAFTNSSHAIIPATVVGGSVDTLTVVVPANAGTGAITVNPNNQSVVTGPVFTLFSITTPNGSVYFPYNYSSGIPQLLKGSGFNPDITQNQLTINGLACTITYVSHTGDSIIYNLPDIINPSVVGSGTGYLTLQTGNLKATAPSTVLYEEVSTLAGGSYGLANGHGKAAQFETIAGITYGHPTGLSDYSSPSYFYVVDREANNVRQVSTDGEVTLIAGSPTGKAGYADGVGAAALFNAPTGIVLDYFGNLWITDSGNFRIRMINMATYQVTTVAGTGVQGTTNGPAASAQFLGPTVLSGGNTSTFGQNQVSFLIVDRGAGKDSLRQLTRDNNNVITISTVKTGTPLVNPQEFSGSDVLDNQAFFNYTTGVPLFGTPGTAGFQNGNPALFNNPSFVTTIRMGTFASSYLISDAGNNVLRVANAKTTAGPYPVSTYIGGMGSNTAGYQDGGFRTAMFNNPGMIYAVTTGQKSFLYVVDVGNHAIRVIN